MTSLALADHHTISPAASAGYAEAYWAFINRIVGWRPPASGATCIDIGCGSGHLTAALHSKGLPMQASEYLEAAVDLVRKHHPELTTVLKNLATFREPGTWDLILAREVYMFTRVNAFTDQAAVISNVIDSLRPGGLFVLAGSDLSHPNCLNYDLAIEVFRRDPRVARVTRRHYEIVLRRLGSCVRGPLSYSLIAGVAQPVIWYKKTFGRFASTYLIGFLRA